MIGIKKDVDFRHRKGSFSFYHWIKANTEKKRVFSCNREPSTSHWYVKITSPYDEEAGNKKEHPTVKPTPKCMTYTTRNDKGYDKW